MARGRENLNSEWNMTTAIGIWQQRVEYGNSEWNIATASVCGGDGSGFSMEVELFPRNCFPE